MWVNPNLIMFEWYCDSEFNQCVCVFLFKHLRRSCGSTLKFKATDKLFEFIELNLSIVIKAESAKPMNDIFLPFANFNCGAICHFLTDGRFLTVVAGFADSLSPCGFQITHPGICLYGLGGSYFWGPEKKWVDKLLSGEKSWEITGNSSTEVAVVVSSPALA